MPFYARPSLDNVSTRIYARIYTRETVVTRVVPLAIPGPDGQTPGVHPVARIFLSHGPAAVTRFLSGQSLLISPRSFIVQSSVTTKHRVVVLFFPSFLPSFLTFSLLQFYPYLLTGGGYTRRLANESHLVKSRGPSESISGYICRLAVVVN